MESSKLSPKTTTEVKARRRLVGSNQGTSRSHLEEYLVKSKALLSIWKKLLILHIILKVSVIAAIAVGGLGAYMLSQGSGDPSSMLVILVIVIVITLLSLLVMGVVSIYRIITTFLCIGRTVELIDDAKTKTSLKEGSNILGLMMASIVVYAIPGINAIGFIANWILKYLFYRNYKKITNSEFVSWN
ncbi:hypothetical protein MHC_01215 [Mycoplasma haemocanis str. Illinois]|uniref:Transmembrane protein n=1 Tax=Mycoplasma haemocanis (strain Illinois) TaxID=1111676 RepID=H6N637_MYCHN|nr:hypothetical protein [Mycoplasma haemocanis]AEW45109.1 hypothetical protein MHC_01215 [Mycoplasma haemocanis str. Illinois]